MPPFRRGNPQGKRRPSARRGPPINPSQGKRFWTRRKVVVGTGIVAALLGVIGLLPKKTQPITVGPRGGTEQGPTEPKTPEQGEKNGRKAVAKEETLVERMQRLEEQRESTRKAMEKYKRGLIKDVTGDPTIKKIAVYSPEESLEYIKNALGDKFSTYKGDPTGTIKEDSVLQIRYPYTDKYGNLKFGITYVLTSKVDEAEKIRIRQVGPYTNTAAYEYYTVEEAPPLGISLDAFLRFVSDPDGIPAKVVWVYNPTK